MSADRDRPGSGVEKFERRTILPEDSCFATARRPVWISLVQTEHFATVGHLASFARDLIRPEGDSSAIGTLSAAYQGVLLVSTSDTVGTRFNINRLPGTLFAGKTTTFHSSSLDEILLHSFLTIVKHHGKDVSLETVERAEGQTGLSIPLTEDERRCERKLKLKLDFIILPLLSTVYFFAQMGRSDVGNAKIAGMDKELHLSSRQYSNIASIFNVGYLVFQLPGTLLVRRIGPSYQFGGAMMAWGMVTACTVAVHSYASLMVIRVFVGVCEAFVQGSVFYLSFWYPYNELATRGAIFFSTAALAGAFNGLIAYGVETDLQGANSWSAWRWLFLIEGILPIGWAFLVVTFLPPTPEKVKFFFSEDEKQLIVKRSRIAHNTGESKIRPKLIMNVLLDPKFWMSVCIESATLFCLQSLSNFLPAILYGFGWSTIKSQFMSVVVYACAFVAIIFSARVSDKTGRRGLVIIANATVASLGYILLLTLKQPAGRFAGACIVAMGLYPNVVINLTWAASTNIGYTHRATATALINSIAQAVAISGNQAYVDPPYYRHGHAASLGMIGFEIVVATTMLFVLKHENEKKKREQHSEKAEEVRGKYTIDDVGNRHPDYFFTL